MGSPALSPPEARDVTLALFGGPKLDVSPSDVPEGVSLNTEDGQYLPGGWYSRDGLARLYGAGVLSNGSSVMYQKTYQQPNDDPLTMILTSDGKLWVEDVGLAPGAPAQKATVPAGLYAQSMTEFGREYIAFSDLLHGQAVPLQFDGTNFDRVTMDGPGAAPAAADSFVSYPLIGTGLDIQYGLAITSATESGNTVSLASIGVGLSLVPGQNFFVQGVGVAGYNGFQTVLAVPDANHVQYNIAAVGLGASAGGAVVAAILSILVNSAVSNVNVGDNVSVSNSTVPAGVFNPNNGQAGNPTTWQVIRVLNPGGPTAEIQVVITASTQTPTAVTSTGGTVQIGGQTSPGVHQLCVIWLTRQGALSKPSPTAQFNSAGNSKWTVTNLPIGPSNVVARVLGFTGAGGSNFFIVPASVKLPNPTNPYATPIIVNSSVVPDNTSTSFTFDISDNTLFAAVAIDQVGNDLFDQVVLGPCLGFYAYAARLCVWGDYTKIENFLNLGFCGGYLSGVLTTPLGWNVVTAGGLLVNGGSWAGGMSWQITGDGTGNPKGQISQSAYQDSFGDAIIQPNTSYFARVWLKPSAAGLNGNVHVTLSSVSASLTMTAGFNLFNAPTAGGFTNLINLGIVPTPSTIPSDLQLIVDESGLNNAATVLIGEIELIFAEDPYRDALSRWSYVNNPEAFAQTTGNLGADDDPSPIRAFTLLRQSSVLGTGEGIHIFNDTTAEPDEWNVNQVTRSLGLLSLKSFDVGKFGTGDGAEDWIAIASPNGAYLFAGGDFWKITQELSRGKQPQSKDPRKTWNDMNLAAQQTVVAKNDPSTRRMYFSVPLNGATTPNTIFVIDYREMDTATQIAAAAPLHITLTGKMRSSDLTRKSSTWNVFANEIEILVRPGNVKQLFFGGAPNASAQAFGNLFSLNPNKLTDDDYGAIGGANGPFYTTYFFTDHEQEAALGLGADRKLVKHVHAFVTGVGLVTITPLVNSLYNFKPALAQRILVADTDTSNFLSDDLEWTTVGLRGNRIAFRISVQPLPGTTDVQIALQKFIVSMMKDPIGQFRQSGV